MSTPDGRTPTLVISGAAGTVTLVNERSAYPFPPQTIERVVQQRETRQSSTGPRKTVFVVRAWNGSEEAIDFSATVTRAQHNTLRSLARANPPAVTATYRDESFPALLLSLSPIPDELGPHDVGQYGPIEFIATVRIQRTDI